MNDTTYLERAVCAMYERERETRGVNASIRYVAGRLHLPELRVRTILGFTYTRLVCSNKLVIDSTDTGPDTVASFYGK